MRSLWRPKCWSGRGAAPMRAALPGAAGGYQKVCVWGHNLEIEENDQREEGYEVRRFDRRAFGEAWDKPGSGAWRKRADRGAKETSCREGSGGGVNPSSWLRQRRSARRGRQPSQWLQQEDGGWGRGSDGDRGSPGSQREFRSPIDCQRAEALRRLR